jgi:dipeptidyl aminopeptidase/acylaminoacyl peptidase
MWRAADSPTSRAGTSPSCRPRRRGKDCPPWSRAPGTPESSTPSPEGAGSAGPTPIPGWREVSLTRQEVHSFLASDGLEIEGILLYPADFRDGVRYPMVIVAHGGPEAHFNNSWLTSYSNWGQLLSRKGYFVWFPNYRASTGRGVAFAKADHGDIMGGEFQDHLDAIHHFAELGWVDRSRVGIGGGSYGGYTAAWAATRHTDHFAAAVSFVPITHVATKWLTSDIPWEFFLVHYEEMWPHEQWDYLEERSPLTYAHQSRTPLLLAGGTVDTRVHPSQPHMLFRAVKETTENPGEVRPVSGGRARQPEQRLPVRLPAPGPAVVRHLPGAGRPATA